MEKEHEDKVVYRDGEEIRAVRGRIVSDTRRGVTIQRRDGILTIARQLILQTRRRAPSTDSTGAVEA